MTVQCKGNNEIENNIECHLDKFLEIIKCSINDIETIEPFENADWKIMTEMSKKQNLLALFHEGAYQIPEYEQSAIFEKNTSVVLGIISRQVKNTDKFLCLYQKFLAQGLQPLVLKGIICRQLYGKHAEHRPSGDEDIYVRKEEFYRYKEILEENGFVCQTPDVTDAKLNQVEHIVFRDKDKFVIEVHVNIMGNRSHLRTQMGNYFRDSFEKSREVTIQNVTIATMSHTQHYVYLIMHAFKHFSGTGVGLRQMIDVMMYQKCYEREIDWDEVRNVLRESNMESYLGDIQHIGKQYFGLQYEEQFPTVDSRALLEDAIRVGVFGKSDNATLIAINITASSLDKKRGKFATILRAGFPSKKQMAESVPYLNEKPWMLPIEWIKRWGRYFKQVKKYDGNLIKDSLKRSEERMELLKKYGL